MHKKSNETPYKIIISAILFFLIIKAFTLDIKRIDGHSMEPTILPGEFILINKLEYGLIIPVIDKYIIRWKKPAVGDIVIARRPDHKTILIKRCLAGAGDELYITNNYLLIHSRIIPWGENYSRENLRLGRVPDDKSVIIGDNYYDSIDSRSFGFVSNFEILGKVFKL